MRRIYKIEGRRLVEVSRGVESYAAIEDEHTTYVSSRVMSVLRLAVEECMKAAGEEKLLVITTLHEQGIVIATARHFFDREEANLFASSRERVFVVDARGDNGVIDHDRVQGGKGQGLSASIGIERVANG